MAGEESASKKLQIRKCIQNSELSTKEFIKKKYHTKTKKKLKKFKRDPKRSLLFQLIIFNVCNLYNPFYS